MYKIILNIFQKKTYLTILILCIFIILLENDTFISFSNYKSSLDLFIIFFNMAFLFIVFVLLYLASKNNLRDIKYQRELIIFKNIIDETNLYIYTKDINGCYLFANKNVLKLFKISSNNLIGKSDHNFFDLEKSRDLKDNDELVIKHGQIIEKIEYAIEKETGKRKIYWVIKKPLYDKNKNIIGMSGISKDITESKESENQIKEQKQLLDLILDNVDAYIYIKDINRKFRYVNTQTAELFGKQVNQIIGYKDTTVLPKEMADIFWESDRNVFSKNEKISIEETIIDKENEVKHYLSIKVPYILNDEKLLIGFSSDITEIYKMKEQLKKDSITDSLTNLYNKRHFEFIAKNEFKRSIRQNIEMSIIIFDIDNFKSINDNYGHHMGDIILKESSNIFKSHIREEDTLCRIGGEEFTIISTHLSSISAINLAERIRVSIQDTFFKPDKKEEFSITISFGISSLTKSDERFEEILLRADKGLYKAKESGKNKVIFL